MTIAEIISQNFLAIFYSVVVIVILFIIAKIINTRERSKERRELADLQLKQKKLDMMENKQYLEELKETSVVLKDEEKEKIDKISRDNAILSRRTLSLMNEIEERMQRLEKGKDHAKLIKTKKEIERLERDMFGEEEK